MNLKAALAACARRFPGAARLARPIAHPIIKIATRDNREWLRRTAAAAALGLVDRQPRLAAMLTAWQGRSARRLIRAAEAPACVGIGSQAAGRSVLMLVVSDLRIDPRVERESRALAQAGYDVTILCPEPGEGTVGRPPIDWGPGITIAFAPWRAASFISEFPGSIGGLLFDEARAIAADKPLLAVHSHDLNTCYVGLAVARTVGAHFVADFHEWTSENVHWDSEAESWGPYPEAWRTHWKALEARVMREASAVVTVSEAIVDALADELGAGRRATLLRNIPALDLTPSEAYPPLKQQLRLPDDSFVLLWQGGTGPTRLIEPIIEALAHAPRCTLVIRGPSLDLYGEAYRSLAERVGASERLILLPPVRSSDVVAAARGADAGIWTLPNLCRNFTYALPNKIFEYMASGLPVLVAQHPEARRLVESHDVGLSFDPYDPHSIATAINRLIDEPDLAFRLRGNVATALREMDAAAEWGKLVALYDALPRKAG